MAPTFVRPTARSGQDWRGRRRHSSPRDRLRPARRRFRASKPWNPRPQPRLSGQASTPIDALARALSRQKRLHRLARAHLRVARMMEIRIFGAKVLQEIHGGWLEEDDPGRPARRRSRRRKCRAVACPEVRRACIAPSVRASWAREAASPRREGEAALDRTASAPANPPDRLSTSAEIQANRDDLVADDGDAKLAEERSPARLSTKACA